MARVGEFCAANITKLLLGVVIALALLLAVGYWVFYSPGRGTPIEHPSNPPATTK